MNKKVFNCETCNYSCEYKYEFDKHSESKKHKRNGKPIEYKCDKCDYIGLNKWNLTMHQATKHYTKEQKKAMKYYCEMCNTICFSQLYYNNHVNSITHKSKTIIVNSNNGLPIESSITEISQNKKTNLKQLEINLKQYIKELFDELKNDLINNKILKK
jgi:hypothetical protein